MRINSTIAMSKTEFTPSGAIVKPIKYSDDSNKQTNSTKESKEFTLNLSTLKEKDFINKLKQSLDSNTSEQVDEETLQSKIVQSILSEANQETALVFDSKFEALQSSGMSVEDAVNASLKNLVKEGYLTQSDGNLINGISFKASQLDSNLEALYDGKGSANDTTIATDSIENAILKASEVLGAIESQDYSQVSRSLELKSNAVNPSSSTGGGTADSSGSVTSASSRAGFLWKPVSESNGKLVVLLPTGLKGQVESVDIYSTLPENGGTPLDKGNFTGNANGDRGHFRFSKPGADYPDNSYVIVKLKDGSQEVFPIGDSSQRNN